MNFSKISSYFLHFSCTFFAIYTLSSKLSRSHLLGLSWVKDKQSVVAIFSTKVIIFESFGNWENLLLTMSDKFINSWRNHFGMTGVILSSSQLKLSWIALSFEDWYKKWNPQFKVSNTRPIIKIDHSTSCIRIFIWNLAYHLIATYWIWISGLIVEILLIKLYYSAEGKIFYRKSDPSNG